jgi:hypothetical protein
MKIMSICVAFADFIKPLMSSLVLEPKERNRDRDRDRDRDKKSASRTQDSKRKQAEKVRTCFYIIFL